MDLTTIFYHVDNFCKEYAKQMDARKLPLSDQKRNNQYCMSLSEIVSVFVYHAACSHEFKTFKAFYKHANSELKSGFPMLVSYGRMTELKEQAQLPLTMFLLCIFGECTGISYVDSTKIEACNIKREYSHKTLKAIAAKGKTGAGWFYGLKLHLVVNHKGEIINLLLTPGNFADNNHGVIDALTNGIWGKMFGDKGYILNPHFWEELYKRGMQIIHGLRSNMKQKIMPFFDKILLRKRASVSEGVFSILKDRMSLQYTKHRSIYGFFCHILSMLIAYQLRPVKPGITFDCANNTELLSLA